MPGSEAPPRPALPRLTRPSFDSASNKDLTMQLPRARRSRLHVPNRRKHSSTGSPVVAHSQSHGGSAQMCVVRRHGSTTVRTYRDPEQAPVRMQLTQSVRKSNDRSKNIPDIRPPLFRNESDVSIFFSGNGLFPLYVDLTAQEGSGLNMNLATPPTVQVFSFPDSGTVKKPKELDPHDWDLPAFKRVNERVFVMKLGFKKAIGASRFFFITVSVTIGTTTVKLTSNLFKVATKPRKMVVGNLDASWSIAALRDLCPGLCALRPRSGASRAAKTSDREAVDITGPDVDHNTSSAGDVRHAFSVMFRTPSRCLAFFAENYMTFYKHRASVHLVPKRPLKMQPPAGLHHAAVTEVTSSADSPVTTFSMSGGSPRVGRSPVARVPSGISAGAGAGAGAGTARVAVPRCRSDSSNAELPIGASPRSATVVGLAPPTEADVDMLVGAPSLPVLPVAAPSVERDVAPNPEAEAAAAPVTPTVVSAERTAYEGEALPLAELGIDLSILSAPISLPVAPPRSVSGSWIPSAPLFERGISLSSIGTVDFAEMDHSLLDGTEMDGECAFPLELRVGNVGWDVIGFGVDSPSVVCSSPALVAPGSRKRRMTEAPTGSMCRPTSMMRTSMSMSH